MIKDLWEKSCKEAKPPEPNQPNYNEALKHLKAAIKLIDEIDDDSNPIKKEQKKIAAKLVLIRNGGIDKDGLFGKKGAQIKGITDCMNNLPADLKALRESVMQEIKLVKDAATLGDGPGKEALKRLDSKNVSDQTLQTR